MGIEQVLVRAGRVAVPVAETLADDALNLVSIVRNKGAIDTVLEAGNLVSQSAKMENLYSTGMLIKSSRAAEALRAISIDLPEDAAHTVFVRHADDLSSAMSGCRTHFVMEHPMPIKGLEEFGLIKSLRTEDQILMSDGFKKVTGLSKVVTATNQDGLGGWGIARYYDTTGTF